MRIEHKRENYFAPNARKVAHRHSSAVAYVSNSDCGQWLYATGFHGRAQKPDFNYRYKSDAKGRALMEKRIRRHFEGWQSIEERKAAQRKAAREFVHDYKVGDVFATHWGYDQTNVEYFECVEVRGKHLIVREIGREFEGTGYDCGKSVPAPGQYIGEPARVLAKPHGFRDPRYKHLASRLEPVAYVGKKPVFGASYESSYH